MSEAMWNELTEICMLAVMNNSPVRGDELILALDNYIGLENIINDTCFCDIREKGYCRIGYELRNGEMRRVYCITQKGMERLNSFVSILEAAEKIKTLL